MSDFTTVRAYPRIHMSLIDLGRATARAYGGIGFSINGLPIEVSVSTTNSPTFEALVPLDKVAQDECEAIIASARTAWGLPTVGVKLSGMPPQHIGLGTKTALKLAILTAVSRHMSVKCTPVELQRLCKRGGASGIGVHAFFRGGVIVDGGHPQPNGPLAPSSLRTAQSIPPLVSRLSFPGAWVVQILLLPGTILNGEREAEFFHANTPIGKAEVLATLATVYHQLVPAFALVDFAALRDGIASIQATGFKLREIEAQSPNVREFLSVASRIPSAAIGMSSLGPLVYVVTVRTDSELRKELEVLCQHHGGESLGTFSGRNSGFARATS